jgi:hypothetical protein
MSPVITSLSETGSSARRSTACRYPSWLEVFKMLYGRKAFLELDESHEANTLFFEKSVDHRSFRRRR